MENSISSIEQGEDKQNHKVILMCSVPCSIHGLWVKVPPVPFPRIGAVAKVGCLP
jgi:hypothetical protein